MVRNRSKPDTERFNKFWRKYRSIFVLGIIALLSIWLVLYPAWHSYFLELWNSDDRKLYLWRALSFIWLFILLVTILWKLLIKYLAPTNFEDRKNLILLVAQILGGIVVIFGLYSTWENLKSAQKTLELAGENQKVALKNQEIAEEGQRTSQQSQITERYNKAVEQLGSKDMNVRVAGIYSLDRIANDSPDKDHWPIMEILTSFVRDTDSLKNGTKRPAGQLPPDIQAVLRVIGWRHPTYPDEGGEDKRLDLHGTDLRGLVLKGDANLAGANLEDTDLSTPETKLRGIVLENALMSGANFEGADLFGANLKDADLGRANIKKTNLHAAQGLTPDQVAAATFYECALYDDKFKVDLESYLHKIGALAPDEKMLCQER